MNAPDVQSMPSSKQFIINRVGVTGVTKPIRVRRNGREIDLTASIDVYVDLPAEYRGSHMSRNVEIVNEIVDESVREPVSGVEDLAMKISWRLLDRHEYATVAETQISSTYFREQTTPEGRKTLEPYRIIAGGKAVRGGMGWKSIGVEVVGMNACPCAMETVRAMLKKKYPDLENCLDRIPIVTHNQRNVTSLCLRVPESVFIEADDLIDIVEDAMSTPTYEILKREDEGRVVLEAHLNPKFVEDIVRDVLGEIVEKYRDLPDDVVVSVRSESEESIHKHNAMAERVTTLGTLRE